MRYTRSVIRKNSLKERKKCLKHVAGETYTKLRSDNRINILKHK